MSDERPSCAPIGTDATAMTDDAIPAGCPCCGALPVDWVDTPPSIATGSDERAREVLLTRITRDRDRLDARDRAGGLGADTHAALRSAIATCDQASLALAASRPTDAGAVVSQVTTQRDIDAATTWWLINHAGNPPQNLVMAFAAHSPALRPVTEEDVERVAKAIYDATHAGLSNCYAWDDEWEPHQEARRGRYYKEARAAIPAALATQKPPVDEDGCIVDAIPEGVRFSHVVEQAQENGTLQKLGTHTLDYLYDSAPPPDWRERCARVAESWQDPAFATDHENRIAKSIAAAIRNLTGDGAGV